MTEIMCPAGMRDYEKMTERLAAENADILLSKAVVSGAASNYFTDAVLNDKFIHMYYSEGRRRIVTVTEPLNLRRQLPCEEYSLQGQGTPVSLFQIDLDNSRIDCGMSYLIRLRDGSIFMIDGGYFTHLQGERLFDLMKSVSCGGRVHIAGWFFSHAHQDHFGCFLDFISAHSHDIDIDGLYYNFPSLSLPEAASWKSSDNSSIREFFYDIDLYLPFVPRHILHTGDSFSLPGVRFEVLFTHEDIYPERIGSFNDTSTVLSVSIGDQRIIFLGDIQTDSCRKLEAMYGKDLSADIVQVSHHGFNGATTETYELISPSTALWPTPDYGFEGNRNRTVNRRLLSMECVKEHIVAGYEGTVRLDFPYKHGNYVKLG